MLCIGMYYPYVSSSSQLFEKELVSDIMYFQHLSLLADLLGSSNCIEDHSSVKLQ